MCTFCTVGSCVTVTGTTECAAFYPSRHPGFDSTHPRSAHTDRGADVVVLYILPTIFFERSPATYAFSASTCLERCFLSTRVYLIATLVEERFPYSHRFIDVDCTRRLATCQLRWLSNNLGFYDRLLFTSLSNDLASNRRTYLR